MEKSVTGEVRLHSYRYEARGLNNGMRWDITRTTTGRGRWSHAKDAGW